MDVMGATLDDVNLAFLGSGSAARPAISSAPLGIRVAGWAKPGLREEAALNRLIGSRISEARSLAGYGSGELAKLLGLATADMTDIEAGRAGAPVWLLRRIADRCVTTVDFLIGDTEESERGEITPTLRDILIRQQHHNDRLRMQEVLEQDSLRTRLEALENLAGRCQEVAAEAASAMQRVVDLNPQWNDIRGGARLQFAIGRTTTMAGRLGRRMARIRNSKNLVQPK